MNSFMKLAQSVGAMLTRKRDAGNKLPLRGRFYAELWRDGKLIHKEAFPNDITNVGVNYLLDTMFNDGTQIANSAWCLGLISNSGYSALANSDTMGSHSGWTEAVGYSQSTRVAWGSGAASARSVTNASAAVFNLNATATLKGVFVTSQNTKGGSTGTLWATALFTSGDIPVVNGDELRVTYATSG